MPDALRRLTNAGYKFKPGEVSEWLDCGNKEVTVYTNQRVLEFDAEKNRKLIADDCELINSKIKRMLKECPNFKILLITEHEPTNEIEFVKILKYFELNNIDLDKVYCINNNSKLDEYKIKYNVTEAKHSKSIKKSSI